MFVVSLLFLVLLFSLHLQEEVAGPEGLYSPDASIGSQSPTSSGDAVASEQAGDGESDDGCPFLISTVTDVQMTLKEKAHVLCLQLYWQRQFVAGDGEFAPGHGEKLADLRALEQEVREDSHLLHHLTLCVLSSVTCELECGT